ncbi:MAG: glycosyltransferase family 4 protein [Flavobacteriaceae bacterium]
MNVLFLTLVRIDSLEERGIYQDLLRKFSKEGHRVFVVTPLERREKRPTQLQKQKLASILQVKTFNIKKTNVVEKGLGTLAIEHQYLRAIKKYLPSIKFDLVLYSTPPITFTKVIEYIKKRDGARSYLLLKDIFPQNAVDMKMLKKGSLLHRMFEKKEKKLYAISDTIGCMSPANVQFVVNHNPEIPKSKVEENPNTIEPFFIDYSKKERDEIRTKYQIPVDKTVLVYGGNFGKPQGLDFLLETIQASKSNKLFFLLVGDGTAYPRIKSWFDANAPANAKLIKRLPKADYDRLLAACDIGLIFLHKDFLIPNFPSRLLSYLEMKKPVLAATDPNTDVGDIVEEAACGFKVMAGDIEGMQKTLNRFEDDALIQQMQENAWKLLVENYTVERSYKLILDKMDV